MILLVEKFKNYRVIGKHKHEEVAFTLYGGQNKPDVETLTNLQIHAEYKDRGK